MKRHAPLSRKTRLMRRTELARTEKSILRRTRIARRGKRGTLQRDRIDVLRPVVFERAGYRCEARIETVCSGRADQAHHVLPRGRGGRDRLDNLLAVCSFCHHHIHKYPEEAVARGLLKQSWDEQ